MMRLLMLAATAALAAAHGSLFIPAPRNSQDNRLPQYENGKSPATACTVRIVDVFALSELPLALRVPARPGKLLSC